jgi:hypothetical protein
MIGIATGASGAEKPALDPQWAEKLFDRTEIDFGVVPAGLVCTRVVSIMNSRRAPIRIRAVRDSGAGVRCTQPAKKILQPGESTTIEVRPDTRRFRGKKESAFWVEFDQPEFADTPIRILWETRTDLVVNPGRFAFGAAKPGSTTSTTVVIRHVGAAHWKIKSASCDDKLFGIAVRETNREKKADGTWDVIYDVTATRRAEAPAGKADTRVLIELDDTRQKSFEILLQGEFGNTAIKQREGTSAR